MKTLTQIKAQVIQLSRQLNAKPQLLPTFGKTMDFGRPHIEVRKNSYHYIVVERGQEISHLVTSELDELFYWIFRVITSQMGYSYEHIHRHPTQDSRRIAFAHALELLDKLNPAWKVKRDAELAETLEKHPFQDGLTN